MMENTNVKSLKRSSLLISSVKLGWGGVAGKMTQYLRALDIQS